MYPYRFAHKYFAMALGFRFGFAVSTASACCGRHQQVRSRECTAIARQTRAHAKRPHVSSPACTSLANRHRHRHRHRGRERERDIHTHVHSFSRAPLMLCTHVRVILSRCQGVRCLLTAFTPSLLHCLAPPPLLHVSLLATPPATHAAAWRSLEATFRLLRCQHCMYVRMACVV